MTKIDHREVVSNFISPMKALVFAEIGVFQGKLCWFLLYKNDNNIKEYWAVDQWKKFEDKKYHKYAIWSQDSWDKWHQKVCKYMIYYNKLKVVRLSSFHCSQLFKTPYFDFVYIDADHFYESVLLDIKSWYPLVKSGGYIGGHDYHWKGVKKAVDEVFDVSNLIILEDGVWITKKL